MPKHYLNGLMPLAIKKSEVIKLEKMEFFKLELVNFEDKMEEFRDK